MTGFQTTRWSIVLEAREGTERARQALENLCRTYRSPVVAYIRGRGCAAADVEDLAQAFFERFQNLLQLGGAIASPKSSLYRLNSARLCF